MRGHYSERFEQALTFAYRLHANQTRKGGDVPYVSHLLAVCGLVMEHGGSEDQAIAALLHDAVEDQGGRATGDAIEGRFGSEVRALVDACSDTDEVPKPPWRRRKEAYLAHLLTASEQVRLISCCDKLHNARTILCELRVIGPRVFDRFSVGPEETLWYYRSLIEAFRATGGPLGLAAELERVIDDIQGLLDERRD
jgi:GTP pyrophosphokinase